MKRYLFILPFFSLLSIGKTMEIMEQATIPFTFNSLTEKNILTFKQKLSENKLEDVKDIVEKFDNNKLPDPNAVTFTSYEPTLVDHLKTDLFTTKKKIYEKTKQEVSFYKLETVEGLLSSLKVETTENIEVELTEANKIIEKAKQTCETAHEKYTQWFKKSGPQPIGLWNQFAYHTLGVEMKDTESYDYQQFTATYFQKFPLSLEHRQTIWKLLKENGIIDSKIEDLKNYRYNPSATLSHLITSTKSPTVVLGCGYFLNSEALRLLNLENKTQTNCGACQKTHALPTEITVNIDPTQAPNILGNITDLEFWKNIPTGKIGKIEDEGCLSNNQNLDLFNQIIDKLEKGGKLTFLGWVSEETMSLLTQIKNIETEKLNGMVSIIKK